MDHTLKNNGGYLSQACSSAEIFAALYLNVLKLGKVERPIVPAQFPGVPGANNANDFPLPCRGHEFIKYSRIT
ncbi:MAG: hypothetical protein PHR20_08600 [Bacteroidales bacterium]|nr:hypothetical protein [Bacteroidales bacterium]